VHVLNIIVTQNLHVTLIKALNGIKVDMNHVCVFGCDPYTHIPIIMQEVGFQELKMHFWMAIVKVQKDVIYWIFFRSIIISGNMTFNKNPIHP